MLSKLLSILLIFATTLAYGQTIVKGKIIDAITTEPLDIATVRCNMPGCLRSCTTNHAGYFEMQCQDCKEMAVSHVGYTAQIFSPAHGLQIISLNTAQSTLQQVVVTANRDGVKRSEAPIANSHLSAKTIRIDIIIS